MPPTNPLNVLVYDGRGTTSESVRHCLYSLRLLLSPHFAVGTVSSDVLLKEPWTASCKLLVFPGGADRAWCDTFNGDGNRKISQYVRRGGSYLGFCAGGYYGSKRCEFEVGDKLLEVTGPRELGFFPGTCRGCAFKGFQYQSENGARASHLSVTTAAAEQPYEFHNYYNGGGVFVDAENFKDKGVEILANYAEDMEVSGGKAAIVHCKFGDGNVVLTGSHPEFAAINLNRELEVSGYAQLVDSIAADDTLRVQFLKTCLSKLGLTIPEGETVIPSLTTIHLTSAEPVHVTGLIERLKPITMGLGGDLVISGHDVFRLHSSSAPPKVVPQPPNRIVDYSEVEKIIEIHEKGFPQTKDTPHFNHHTFYEALEKYRSQSRSSPSQFGQFLLYGEVVTSTNMLLDKNPQFLEKLPNGTTFTAAIQVAGRGRGSNVWVSPMGSLMFSVCIRHALELNAQAPIIFLQYIVALAIVEGVKSYEPGYRDIPIRLKWPNDIYAQDPSLPDGSPNSFVKIGGILVNSSFSQNQFNCVVGVGLNVSNAAPTTSLNLILSHHNFLREKKGLRPLPQFQQDKLLARVLVVFEEMYYRFCVSGFSSFEQNYYQQWLHSDQIVTLENEGGIKAKIRGISMDYGHLRAEEMRDGKVTGKMFSMMSDNNSFDFFKGLVKTKI